MQTIGNDARKTHCTQKVLQCKQWVMKKLSHKELEFKQRVIKRGRTIFHTQRVTMQTMGNEARK
ncbi:hypothetical protein KSS87_019912 [Heliosperma pusillum]|nr:hypothetical protein KSS87_019912 [Heliosperma pusillum]